MKLSLFKNTVALILLSVLNLTQAWSAPVAPTISSWPDGKYLKNPTQKIRGVCQNGASVRVYGNISGSSFQTTCASRKYLVNVTFTTGDGQKVINVTQSDTSGTSPVATKTVNLDSTAPVAPIINSPGNRATLTSRNVTVTGRCEAGTTLIFSGTIVSPNSTSLCTNGNFSFPVQLTSGNGAKKIAVRQRDLAFNNSKWNNRHITLNEPSNNLSGWEPKTSNRVFFSGHSLIDNPLPDFIESIAQSQNRAIAWNQHNVIGSPMRVRVEGWDRYSGKGQDGRDIHFINEVRNPTVLGAGNKYDSMVLTERHGPIGVMLWEGTIPYLKLFSDFMNSENPTRMFFYHPWLDINKANPNPWINYHLEEQKIWECASAVVNSEYKRVNSNNRIINLPASGALADLTDKIVKGQIPGFTGSTSAKMNQIFVDNVHMTQVGNYYLAILNYIVLYGVKPTINVNSLPSGYNFAPLNQANTLNAVIDQAWDYTTNYFNSGSKDYTVAQCKSYAPAFCNTQQVYNGSNYNSCINDVNYIFDHLPSGNDWFPLPN